LLSSISISEREEGPEGIAGVIRCEKPRVAANMAQRAREKRSKGLISGEDHGNFTLKPGWVAGVFWTGSTCQSRYLGFCVTVLYLGALAAMSFALSVLMAGAYGAAANWGSHYQMKAAASPGRSALRNPG
jgi:hypothetical protein